jgi:hypothetical protein
MSTGDLIRDRDRDDDREEEEQRVVVAAAAPGRYSAEERRERASTSTVPEQAQLPKEDHGLSLCGHVWMGVLVLV